MSSTSWRGRELFGSQTPRVWSAPSAVTSAGPEAVRLGELAGLEPMPWQRFFCEKALGQVVEPDGFWRWAAFEILLLVSRQNGKGTCIEIVELYVLFSLGLNVYHTAQLMETSRKAAERLLLLIERTPQLRRRVREVKRTAEKIHITLTSGAFITFMARSSKSGRGFDDANVIVFDEAMFLEARMTEAIIPTMTTRATPLVLYASSAGLAESVLLRALRKRVIDRGAGIAGFDWSVDPDAVKAEDFDPLAVDVVAQANPSLGPPGSLVTMDFVHGEYAALTSTGKVQGYFRERLGVFDEDPAVVRKVIPKQAWTDRGGLGDEERPESRIAFAVSATWPDAAAATIVVSGQLPAETWSVQIAAQAPGTAWVIEWLRERIVRHSPCTVAIDPGGPAGFLIEDVETMIAELEDVVVVLVEPTVREVAHAAGQFRAAILDEPTLRHYDEPVLTKAVLAATSRPLANAWTWAVRDEQDIAPTEAASLALWAATTHGVADPLDNIW